MRQFVELFCAGSSPVDHPNYSKGKQTLALFVSGLAPAKWCVEAMYGFLRASVAFFNNS
jgi:hypothetical protein